MEELVDLMPDSSQEDLNTENTPDGMDGEQTWPTEEELREVDQQAALGKKTVRIPRGTSDYQAAWIMEDSQPRGVEDDQDEDEPEEEEDETMGETPLEVEEGCSQEGSEAEEEEDGGEEEEEGGEEDMVDEEQSETVANTEDYDAKHVRFR